MKRAKRYVRKQGKRAVNFAKKRYWPKGPNVANILKDVAFLKSVINAEKKKRQHLAIGNIGQLYGSTGSGHYITQLIPAMTQGTSGDEFTGDSLKLHSLHMSMQFLQMPALANKMRINWAIVQVKGEPYTTIGDAIGDYLDPSLFISGGSIYDNFSQRNQNKYSWFKVHRRGTINLARDPISSMQTQTTVNINHKWHNGKGHHLRFNPVDQALESGQLFIVFTANCGNVDPSNASTTSGAIFNTANSGATFNMSTTHYFFDN